MVMMSCTHDMVYIVLYTECEHIYDIVAYPSCVHGYLYDSMTLYEYVVRDNGIVL